MPIGTSNTLQPGTSHHRRQSSINTVSWTDQGETSSGRIQTILNNQNTTNVGFYMNLK